MVKPVSYLSLTFPAMRIYVNGKDPRYLINTFETYHNILSWFLLALLQKFEQVTKKFNFQFDSFFRPTVQKLIFVFSL